MDSRCTQTPISILSEILGKDAYQSTAGKKNNDHSKLSVGKSCSIDVLTLPGKGFLQDLNTVSVDSKDSSVDSGVVADQHVSTDEGSIDSDKTDIAHNVDCSTQNEKFVTVMKKGPADMIGKHNCEKIDVHDYNSQTHSIQYFSPNINSLYYNENDSGVDNVNSSIFNNNIGAYTHVWPPILTNGYYPPTTGYWAITPDSALNNNSSAFDAYMQASPSIDSLENYHPQQQYESLHSLSPPGLHVPAYYYPDQYLVPPPALSSLSTVLQLPQQHKGNQ